MIPFQLHRRIPLVRRPFFQRDQAMRERDAVIAERDALAAERDRLGRAATIEREKAVASFARTLAPMTTDESDLVPRIIQAYCKSLAVFVASRSFWESEYFDIKRDVHDAIITGDVETVRKMLRDPGSTDLFYGFEDLSRRLLPLPMDERAQSARIVELFLRLCEAQGLPIRNPEAPPAEPTPVNALVSSLDARIDFPNPFPGETGIATERGVASHRAVQAIYQAMRIAALTEAPAARILEIGAGLGRTAYYVQRLGIRDYTIIDLPITLVAQSYFLGCTLGPDAICLFGEDRPGVRLLPPAAFFSTTDQYNLAMNVDSLPELDPDVARAYCAAIKTRAGTFLSINHEANQFTVSEICGEVGMRRRQRHKYWMRRGYVEEIFAPDACT